MVRAIRGGSHRGLRLRREDHSPGHAQASFKSHRAPKPRRATASRRTRYAILRRRSPMKEWPLKITLVEADRMDLPCLWCGRTRCELAIDNCLPAGPFAGIHRKCYAALQQDQCAEKQ